MAPRESALRCDAASFIQCDAARFLHGFIHSSLAELGFVHAFLYYSGHVLPRARGVRSVHAHDACFASLSLAA